MSLGGLPDLADQVRTEGNEAPGEKRLEGLEDVDPKTIAAGNYQSSVTEDKLIDGANLRAADNSGLTEPHSG